METFNWCKPSECKSIWAWVLYEWNFTNKDNLREIGYRIFGFEFVRTIPVAMWLKQIEGDF